MTILQQIPIICFTFTILLPQKLVLTNPVLNKDDNYLNWNHEIYKELNRLNTYTNNRVRRQSQNNQSNENTTKLPKFDGGKKLPGDRTIEETTKDYGSCAEMKMSGTLAKYLRINPDKKCCNEMDTTGKLKI